MKLLLCPGTCYAASTPMFYTLAYYNKYCHTGHKKENDYLYGLYLDQTKDVKRILRQTSQFKTKLKNIGKGHVRKNHIPMPDDFSLAEVWKRPFSIEKYCEYYERVWDIVKDHEYESVADFSTALIGVSEQFLHSISSTLLKHFDIKVIIMFRDPVRRFWSHRGDIDAKLDNRVMYAQNYQKFCNVFGKENVYPVIMEDFWSKEISGLCEFLNYDIKEISENVYWPITDTLEKYPSLKDQWCEEKELPSNYIPILRKKLNSVYLQFEEVFGKIPERWTV